MDKISIFIDGGYLDNLLIKDFNKAKIDYHKLQEKISSGFDLLRTYYYFCPVYRSSSPSQEEKDRQRKQSEWIYNLNRIPHFQTKQGYLKRFIGLDGKFKYEQKLVDVLFAVDLTRMAWQKSIQRAAIISGDGDFIPAVEDIKNAGIVVALYYSEKACADQLIEICDERTIINQDFIDSILFK